MRESGHVVTSVSRSETANRKFAGKGSKRDLDDRNHRRVVQPREWVRSRNQDRQHRRTTDGVDKEGKAGCLGKDARQGRLRGKGLPENFGLAVKPGAVEALAVETRLDRHACCHFLPWSGQRSLLPWRPFQHRRETQHVDVPRGVAEGFGPRTGPSTSIG